MPNREIRLSNASDQVTGSDNLVAKRQKRDNPHHEEGYDSLSYDQRKSKEGSYDYDPLKRKNDSITAIGYEGQLQKQRASMWSRKQDHDLFDAYGGGENQGASPMDRYPAQTSGNSTEGQDTQHDANTTQVRDVSDVVPQLTADIDKYLKSTDRNDRALNSIRDRITNESIKQAALDHIQSNYVINRRIANYDSKASTLYYANISKMRF